VNRPDWSTSTTTTTTRGSAIVRISHSLIAVSIIADMWGKKGGRMSYMIIKILTLKIKR
jgi:hypothetical protein